MRSRNCFPLVLIAFAGLSIFAAAGAPNPIGFPAKVPDGGGIGMFRIWYADGTWHLRTSTDDSGGKKDKLLVFTGSVTSDDKITARGEKLEKKGKTRDTLSPHSNGKGFDFRFATYGGTDEATFTVASSSKSLRFKLLVDGVEAIPVRIFIGKDAINPAKSEFTLPAHPK